MFQSGVDTPVSLHVFQGIGLYNFVLVPCAAHALPVTSALPVGRLETSVYMQQALFSDKNCSLYTASRRTFNSCVQSVLVSPTKVQIPAQTNRNNETKEGFQGHCVSPKASLRTRSHHTSRVHPESSKLTAAVVRRHAFLTCLQPVSV